MTVILKKCPFCNSTDINLGHTRENWPAIQCNECGALGPCTDLDADEAGRQWNTRAAPQPETAGVRERIAEAIYNVEPHYEGGDYVDGFQVTPGGNLSWDQAKARDAEFGDDPLMGKITEFAYRCADALTPATRSYADRAQSATAFDPELQADGDAEKRT